MPTERAAIVETPIANMLLVLAAISAGLLAQRVVDLRAEFPVYAGDVQKTVLAVDRDGPLYLNARPIAEEDVSGKLVDILENSGDKRVLRTP